MTPSARRRPLRWIAFGILVSAGLVTTAYLAMPTRAAQTIGTMSRIALVRGGLMAAPLMKPSAATARHRPDDIELCGAGWFVKSAEADPAFLAIKVRALNDARTHAGIVDRLRAAPGERAHATALLIGLLGLDQPLDPLRDRVDHDAAPAREALAAMAVTTTDPKVYALAMLACRDAPDAGNCPRITAAQWVRLDPGNAVPWMTVLDEAAQAQDGAAVAEALHRIGTSARNDLAAFVTLAEVLKVAPDDDASLPAIDRLLIELNSIMTVTPLRSFHHIGTACQGDALRDVNRAQICDAIAELLVDRSDSLIDSDFGLDLATRMGWPADKVDRLRRERAAFMPRMLSSPSGAQPYGCETLRRRVEFRRTVVAARGEIGALKAWQADPARAASAAR